MLKVLYEGCEPTKGSKHSAGIDLYASEDIVIGAGETAIVGLGVCIDLAKLKLKIKGREGKHFEDREKFISSHYLELHPRSSLRAKGLMSGVGIIDLDYENEIKIVIHNQIKKVSSDFSLIGAICDKENSFVYGSYAYTINKGDKIAQILLKKHEGYLIGVESLEERVGGIGSTGE